MINKFQEQLRDLYKTGLDLAQQDKIETESLSQIYKRRTLIEKMKDVLDDGIGILPKSMTDEDQEYLKKMEEQIKKLSEDYDKKENYGMNTEQELPNFVESYKEIISSGEHNDVFIEFFPHFENDEIFLNTLIEKLQKSGHSIKLLHTHTPDLEAEEGLSNKSLYVSMKSSDYGKYTDLFRSKKRKW